MTAERETARTVRSWLREDEHESADRILEIVLDRLDTTPQRPSWWPARRSRMNTVSKLLGAAAAVLVVAFVGSRFLPGTGFGGPGGTVPTASPAPTAIPLSSDDTATLAAGDHVIGAPFPIQITVTLPAGWHGHVAGPYYADLWTTGKTGGLYFVRPSMLAVDPCNVTKRFAGVGESVDDLTSALQRIPGLTVTDIASTTVAGYQGTSLVATARASFSGCSVGADGFVIWQNPLGGTSPTFSVGESIHFWILDVAGARLVIANQDAGYSANDRAQTQAVFDSIRIAPAS